MPRFGLALLLGIACAPVVGEAALDEAVFIAEWGRKVPLPGGSLQTPTANAVDSATGDVYVVEPFRIQRWDRDGQFLLGWPCECTGVDVNAVTHEVYATLGTRHKVARYSPNGELIGEWGVLGSGPGEFNQPFGVTVDSGAEEVYVFDTGNGRVQVSDLDGNFLRSIDDPRLEMWPGAPGGLAFDPTDEVLWVANAARNVVLKFDPLGGFLLQIGAGLPRLEPGQFRWPRSVAVDDAGRVFVTDTDSERIQFFDRDGRFLGIFQGPHNRADGPFHPRDIAINLETNEKYALAAYAARIDKFGAENDYVLSFGGREKDGLFFLGPRGIAVSPKTDDVYVFDTGNFLIKRITPGGAFVSQFGGSLRVSLTEPGLFGSFISSALTVGPDGNVWAGLVGIHYSEDPDLQFIQKFDPDGRHLSSFFRTGMGHYFERVRQLAVEPDTGNVWSADSRLRKAQRFDPSGTLLLEIPIPGTPAGIAYRDGTVYVTDVAENRVFTFDRGGVLLGAWGGPGGAPGQFRLADSSGVATDTNGRVYVADTLNHRVQQFTSAGEVLGQLGSFGTGPGEFRLPTDVALSTDSNILYVLDNANHRVQLFCLAPTALDRCAAQLDRDNDGVRDGLDVCPGLSDPDQRDRDGDGVGDSCDEDLDGDGARNDVDNCPYVASSSHPDRDGNGVGDLCQCGDVNGDGLTNVVDALVIARGELGLGNPYFGRCDVDGDGSCDIGDALRIARGETGHRGSDQLCPSYYGPDG